MTIYNTGNPIGSTAPQDLYDNAQNFDRAVNDVLADTWTDRFGQVRRTLSGADRDATIQIDRAEAAANQAVAAASASGDFKFVDNLAGMAAILPQPDGTIIEVASDADHSNHRTRYVVAAGVPVFKVDLNFAEAQLAAQLAATNGVDLVGGAMTEVRGYAELDAYTGSKTELYLTDAGVAGTWVKTGDSAKTPDIGTVRLVDGVIWERMYIGPLLSSWWGLPKAGDCYDELSKIEALMFATGRDCVFPNGEYAITGSRNMPWRNPDVTGFRDYKGAALIAQGPGTVFKTTSADGADVFQLNCVSNLSILGFPTIKASLTATLGAGSNGVSITNGARNVFVEVEAEDLPYVDKGSYLDGGKAITIQTGSLTQLPIENVHMHCRRAKNCAYGYEASLDATRLITNAVTGVRIDIFADEAYRGVAVGGSAPGSGVPSNGLNFGMAINARLKDCQQVVSIDKGWHVRVDATVMQTTNTFRAWKPSDTEKYVLSATGAKICDVTIDGTVLSVDALYKIGGAVFNSGVSGVVGYSENCNFDLSVKYQTATFPLKWVDSGGNTVSSCRFSTQGLGAGNWQTAFANGCTVFSGGQIQSRDPFFYGTVAMFDTSGAKKFGVRSDGNIETPLTTSSPIGAYVGKVAVYNPVGGALLGYVPVYK